MRGSRFSIAGVMFVVAIAALDSQAIRVLLESDFQVVGLLLVGVLPMLNLLAIGLLLLRRPRTRRGRGGPFLVGFEAFGGAAMLFVLLALAVPVARMILFGWLGVMLRPIERTWGLSPPITTAVIITAVVGLLLLPQLLFAILGGWLSSRYRVVIVRRRPGDPRPISRAMEVRDPVGARSELGGAP